MTSVGNNHSESPSFALTLDLSFFPQARETLVALRHEMLSMDAEFLDNVDSIDISFPVEVSNNSDAVKVLAERLSQFVPSEDSLSYLGCRFNECVDIDKVTLESLLVLPSRPLLESLAENDQTETQEGFGTDRIRMSVFANGEPVHNFSQDFDDQTSARLTIERNESSASPMYDIIGEAMIDDESDYCGIAGRAQKLIEKLINRANQLRANTIVWLDAVM